MGQETKIDPKHATTRSILRILGPAIAFLGLVLTVIGFGSLFSSAGSFEPPRYFWCAFVGLPLLAVGLALCSFPFFGAWLRFVAGEAAPVQKDTFNYLADGTKEGVRTVATALGEGLSAGMGRGHAGSRCPRCEQSNDADARFCKNCGAPVA